MLQNLFNKYIVIVSFFITLITVVSNADQSSAEKKLEVLEKIGVSQTTVRSNSYPSPNITFTNGSIGVSDLTYSNQVGFRPLDLDLYLPPSTMQKPASGFPLIVFIHGGGWQVGDRRRMGVFDNFPEVLASIAANGYVVSSVSYRLSGEAKFPAQILDIKTAIKWLRFNSKKYNIDPDKVITWGVSAGGHLASLAAVSCGANFDKSLGVEQGNTFKVPDGVKAAAGVENQSDCVQGAVSWYGVYDLDTIAAQAGQLSQLYPNFKETEAAPSSKLLGCVGADCKNNERQTASPVTYVNANTPPMLLLAGDADKTVPFLQAVEMHEKLEANKIPHQYFLYPNVDHVLIGADLETTRKDNIDALKRSLQFFNSRVEELNKNTSKE